MKKDKKNNSAIKSYKKPRLVKFSKIARIQASVAIVENPEFI